MTERKKNRKQHILQNLALMLEQELSDRITTAKLAKQVGVSEAALYRHFPSKARMYESLLDFSEETVFSRINQIKAEPMDCHEKLNKISFLVLGFCQKNPGLCRLLNGEVLFGEPQRLKERTSQFFDRIELELKQLYREDAVKNKRSTENATNIAKFISAMIEGRIQQFVRSKFNIDPTEGWNHQWQLIMRGMQS